ncbi:MAG: VOC family protein [Dehalococcoidia bacterium]
MANESAVRQRIVPMLDYEDGPAAMDWLIQAFGFTERMRLVNPEGSLGHGELELGGNIIMLGTATPLYQSPRRHRESCAAAAAWHEVPWVIDGVFVEVDDIRAHFEQARDAGATILTEVEEAGFGGWIYRAEDVEGHRWMFHQEQA